MRGFVSAIPVVANAVRAILLASTVAAFAQGPGPTAGKPAGGTAAPAPSHLASLLISADAVYAWTLDGDLQGMTSADMHPKVVNVAKLGTHEIVITSPDGSVKIRQTVTVKAGEQTVVHFTATSIVVNGGSLDGRPFPTAEDRKKFDATVEDMQTQRIKDHPENFARIQPVSAYKGMSPQAPNKWAVNLMVTAIYGKYDPKVQMAVQDKSGNWRQLPDAQHGATPAVYQVLAEDLGAEVAVCYSAKSDLFPGAMRETAFFLVKPGAQMPGRQVTFEDAKAPTLAPASDAPCGGKASTTAEPISEVSAPAASASPGPMADNPKYFGAITSSILRYKNQWRLNLVVKPWRLGTTYYDEQVQLTLKGVPGHAEPVPVSNLQPASLPGTYQVMIDNLGTEAVVCYTAKDPRRQTPMRMTAWYKVNAGDSAANLTPSREPSLAPASGAPCE